MKTAFIIDDGKYESLLRFTETKLFFDAKNVATKFFKDCYVIKDEKEIPSNIDNSVILTSGDFLTTTFRRKHSDNFSIIDSRSSNDVIRYSKDTDISFKKRINYPKDSKHLYIVENMLRVCSRAKNLVYLDNTEPLNIRKVDNKHFYGLASGWKSVMLACANNFDTVTIYDINERQLHYAKMLHEYPELLDKINITNNISGEYSPTNEVREAWYKWHKTKVNFEIIDLFKIPKFPPDSFVWISNAFLYEPNIFRYGWSKCKQSHLDLIKTNKDSIITTN